MNNEQLIGYDVRVAPEYLKASEPGYLRDFAINDKAENVLTVDTLIWPSAFSRSMQRERWIGPNCGLWEKIEEIRDQSKPLNGEILWLIAATIVTDETTILPVGGIQTIDSELSAESVFIGYDVADSSMLSVLSNCAYSSSEMLEFRLSHTSLLNKFNLFNTASDALYFCQIAAERVPEHAHSYCIGLYKISWTAEDASHQSRVLTLRSESEQARPLAPPRKPLEDSSCSPLRSLTRDSLGTMKISNFELITDESVEGWSRVIEAYGRKWDLHSSTHYG